MRINTMCWNLSNIWGWNYVSRDIFIFYIPDLEDFKDQNLQMVLTKDFM